MEKDKQDAINVMMQKLNQLTTDLIDDVECAFIECLQTIGVDPVEHAEYINSETTRWLNDVSERAVTQHRFRLMMREYKRGESK